MTNQRTSLEAGSEEEAFITVDTDLNDSEFGDSQSELTSLRSSITNYYYENGRRYHAYHAGAYWGPNDDQAQESMKVGHEVYRLLLNGKLYLAPIAQDPKDVLDIGTGTGSWAVEFGDMHPSARVIGTDLSPIQPSFAPPNVQFEVDDCCDPWLYEKDKFDFVHVRSLYGCVADWDKFYKEAYKHIKPGGYIEQLEQSVHGKSDDGTTTGTMYNEWAQHFFNAGDKFGKTFRVVDEAKSRMQKAGFVDVVERRYKCPLGPWPKDPHFKLLGKLNRVYAEEGIEGYAMMLFTNVLDWTREEVEVYLARMRNTLRDSSIHAYQEMVVVYGREPLVGEAAKTS
ncbi:class I SAM-dependent methyltransferase [Aspergillus alliaceus]|uniref:class I SAM-dependent methyltransferase n=1 Tax=Petromyces alliaceus TaxID=209559 RepID=UPI0012A64945|nr:SAM dependent methyltransferase [Aspergillus alliaceus]KAB8232620.1 SAM dependent methyltransferase [Aspergillus alliaceus]